MAVVKVLYRFKNVSFSLLWNNQLSSELYRHGRNEVSKLKAGNTDVLSNNLNFCPVFSFLVMEINILCSAEMLQ